MKTLMTTTALVVATAMPLAAKEMTKDRDAVFMDYHETDVTAPEMLASDLIGMRVYASENEITAKRAATVDADWNDIGEVSDVIMSRDGETESILLDIGGFLGIGEKTVAVNFDELHFVPSGDGRGDFFLAFNASQQMMEDAEPFDFDQLGAWTSAQWAEAKANASDAVNSLQNSVSATAEDVENSAEETAKDIKQSTMATADEIQQSAAEAADATADAVSAAGAEIEQTASSVTAPEITRDGYEAVKASALTSEMLTGAPVYDTRDEWIGEVGELILDNNGQVDTAVIDVGGFLGIGEKPVAKTLDSLTIKRATDDGALRVYVDATQKELEDMPAYEGS